MADFGSPVATQVNPVNGLDMMSKLLNLKQQQQQLQSGALSIQQQQQGLQGQAAQVQQEQQTARQRAGIAGFMQNFDPSEHVGKDGTLDLDGVFADPKLRVAAGDQFPQLMQSLLQVKGTQLDAKQRLAVLNDSLRDQFSRGVGSLREDPDVKAGNETGRGKVADFITSFGESGGPDAQRVAQAYAPVIAHAPHGKLSETLSHLQLQAMDAGTQAGRQMPTYLDTGGGFVQTNPQAPAAPAGAPPSGGPAPGQRVAAGPPGSIPKTLAPTQQPSYLGTAANVEPDAQRYNQISGSSQNAHTMMSLSDQVAALADQVRTGKFSKDVTDYAATVGQKNPGIAARQMLTKYAAQLKAMAEGGASTDAERSTVEQGMPNPDTMGPEALKEAARYIGGMGAMRLDRSARAADFVRKNGGTNGMRAADDTFTRGADPSLYMYQRMQDVNERTQYLLNRFGNGKQITDKAGAIAFSQRARGAGGAGQ